MLRRNIKKIIKRLDYNHYETYNVIEISRNNLLHNLHFFQNQNPNQLVIPVIKSNAYGHGLREVSSILESAGVKLVAVDGYFEANTVIETTSCDVLVMGAVRPENAHIVNTKRCSFVVQDIDTLRAFAELNKKVRIHLELNTGMNRLGLSENELAPYLSFLKSNPQLQLEGVMSHLADADNPSNDFTIRQAELFNSMVGHILSEGWNPKYIHLAQTAGTTKISNHQTNALRLGIGLYGINPLQPDDDQYQNLEKLKPVLSLKSTVIKVQELTKGDKVSYNGIFTATSPTRIGVLPVGYYEGYPRSLSNKGIVTYKQKPQPVVGRVCMNHTMINITDSDSKVGSVVTLIDTDQNAPNSVKNICKDHDLFSYQLVTGLSEKVKRIVV